jgi:glycerol-3-phosphate dehydrogenase
VGAGVARDAAMRGLRTGLVEQYDFAFGTSSRSSRLLHGGLRYLAQGRIGLVHEASVEKCAIHRIAPHLADPLPFVFPTYRGTPWAPWALWKMRIGVKIYDLLCGGRNLGKSSSFNTRAMQQYLPGINAQDLTGGVRYFDGLTNDARLVLDTLRSAVKAGASVLNYCHLQSAEPAKDAWRCEFRDQQTGQTFALTTKTIVHAAGPWAEKLRHSSVHLRLTKGIHLVVDRKRLPVPDAIVMTEGKRILFAIPWAERVILGTTDTDYTGPIEDVHTEPRDARYVLQVVNQSFPEAHLTERDIIGHWAGLRPLVADPNGKPADISRAHEIVEPTPGWFDVTGGKLTTYRLMAEQTVDQVTRRLARPPLPCTTAREPLLTVQETKDISSIAPPAVSKNVVEHFCRNEWAEHLDDVMIRRTSWHYYRTDAASIARQTADWMAETLGWNEQQLAEELSHYLEMDREKYRQVGIGI